MSRYEEVGSQVSNIVFDIISDEFPELQGANIKVVFDTKKKIVSGKISIARIKKLNEELKFLAMDETGVEFNYLMMLDKNGRRLRARR